MFSSNNSQHRGVMHISLVILGLFVSLAISQDSTSTALVTSIETIISCAPDVTDCPGRSSTTIATSIPAVTDEPQLTSTALVTEVETITSCAPEVTDCPLRTKTSTLVSVTPTLSAVISTGAIVTQNGTAYSVYEATTITIPCSSCAVASSTPAIVNTPIVDAATVTVTQSVCPTASSVLPAYPELAVSQATTSPSAAATDLASTPAEAATPVPAADAAPTADESLPAAAASGSETSVWPSSIIAGTAPAPAATGTGGYSGIPFTGAAEKKSVMTSWTLGALGIAAIGFAFL